MDDFLERWRIQIIAVLLVVIGVGIIVLLARWPRLSSSVAEAGSAPSKLPQTVLPAIRTAEPRQLKVYVTGAVMRPGVYTFRDGDRVEDALKAAGGATADADLSRLNLAQRLRDEGYVTVPRKSDTPVLAPTFSSASGPVSSPAASGKVNINTASLAELDALPGIGATYAQRIIDYRTKNGPFQTINDLVSKKIVPQSTFDKMKDLIAVW